MSPVGIFLPWFAFSRSIFICMTFQTHCTGVYEIAKCFSVAFCRCLMVSNSRSSLVLISLNVNNAVR